MKATHPARITPAVLLTLACGSGLQAGFTPQLSLVYETTVTGFYLASGQQMTVDPQGNAYVAGRAIDAENDIVVVKLDAEGDLLWTTHIRGNDHDYATGVVLDDANDLYITGWTDSSDFPIVDGIQTTLTGFRDAFVMKLASQDGAILYSTFLGGDYADEAHGITLNGAGEIYLVGSTQSSDFPTVDPIQGGPIGNPYSYSDAFITKLSADGSTILYSTYLGGAKDDRAVALELDADGNVIFAGNTDSANFPMMNPIQAAYAGEQDIFVTRLSADGSVIDYSTYLGGEDWDRVARLVLDSSGNAYVAGSTRSIAFPTTPGAFQEQFVGAILGCEVPFGADHNCDDAFVTKLTPDGSALAYSTYLGGTGTDEARDLAVDSAGRAHVVGYTVSQDFPPAGISSAADIFVSKLGASGSELLYTHTTDSASANAGHGIAVDADDDVYFTGAINAPADVYIAKITEQSDCESDLDGDGSTGVVDFLALLAAWGPCSNCSADLDTDGRVDI
ncbi:MAG: SBBP repeat-containing protein, partial [Planctomycetota bacterium]